MSTLDRPVHPNPYDLLPRVPCVVSFNLAFKTLGRAILHGTYQH